MTRADDRFDTPRSRRACFASIARAAFGVTFAERFVAPALGAPRADAAARSIVTLFMDGGMSHVDTFDPKPGREEMGPTGVLRTNVPGILVGDGLERVAGMADRLAVLRAVSAKAADHEIARYTFRTSYAPTNAIRHPALGSWALLTSGYDSDLPGYVLVGDGNTHPGCGFLDPVHGPVSIIEPRTLPPAATELDLYKRLLISTHIDGSFRSRYDSQQTQAYDRMYARAVRLLGSADLQAFDLAKEPPQVRERYGDSHFGQGCLLARRLVEAGVQSIDVDLTGWDDHADIFNPGKAPARVRTLDRGLAALLDDLDERGLLDSTLVVVATEFGRTPYINGAKGRDHHPAAFSCVLAGAGVKRGFVHGATDERGYTVESGEITHADLNKTIAEALGLPHDREFRAPNGRPFRIGGEGRVVREVLA